MYAGMRGISETLGFFHMMREFSACRAIMLRGVCGGLKQITVKAFFGPRSSPG